MKRGSQPRARSPSIARGDPLHPHIVHNGAGARPRAAHYPDRPGSGCGKRGVRGRAGRQSPGPERARVEGRGLHGGRPSSYCRPPTPAKPPTPEPIWAPRAWREEDLGNPERPSGAGQRRAHPGSASPAGSQIALCPRRLRAPRALPE